MRAIFFDDAAAAAAQARLAGAGYTAEVVRERLAGEDDEDDHPWAVLSDAPEVVLDLLVEEFEGWLDFEDQPSADFPGSVRGASGTPGPMDLPEAPKRIKRPDLLD